MKGSFDPEGVTTHRVRITTGLGAHYAAQDGLEFTKALLLPGITGSHHTGHNGFFHQASAAWLSCRKSCLYLTGGSLSLLINAFHFIQNIPLSQTIRRHFLSWAEADLLKLNHCKHLLPSKLWDLPYLLPRGLPRFTPNENVAEENLGKLAHTKRGRGGCPSRHSWL